MRSFTSLAMASMAISMASARYTFSGLLVNGELVGDEFQYVREHTRSYMPTFREEAATSDDFRCNQGAFSGNDTDVYTVKSGDVVGLRQAFGAGGIEHPGPTQLYLSKAPDSVNDYDGRGDWIKVYCHVFEGKHGANTSGSLLWMRKHETKNWSYQICGNLFQMGLIMTRLLTLNHFSEMSRLQGGLKTSEKVFDKI